MRTRRPAVVAVLALLLAAAACTSSGSDDATDATPTTTLRSTPTTVEATTTTTTTSAAGTGKTTTTVVTGNYPTGDEKRIPLLLEPDDFGAGLKITNPKDDAPNKEFCKGVEVTSQWQASATMSATAGDGSALGATESILEFPPGDAAKFMAEFPSISERCAQAQGQPT